MREFLQELEEKLIVVDAIGKIRYCDERLEKDLKYSQEELVGSTIYHLIGGREIAESILRESSSTKGCYVLDLEKKSGEKVAYDIRVIQMEWEEEVCFGILCLEIEEEEYTKEELRLILEHLPFLIVARSKVGEYTYINERANHHYEMADEDILGKHNKEIFGEKMGEAFDQDDEKAMNQGENQQTETWIKTPKGNMKKVKFEKIPLWNKGEVTGIVKFARELSETSGGFWDGKRNYDSFFEKLIKDNEHFFLREKEVLEEIGAAGMGIWVYSAKKQAFSCQARMGINSVLEELGEKVENYTKGKAPSVHRISGKVYALEWIERQVADMGWWTNKVREKGVNYIGVHDIVCEGELLGMVIIFYKEYKETQETKVEVARVCTMISEVLKPMKLAQDLSYELRERVEAEKELEHFLETATDGLLVLDEEGNVLKENVNANRLLRCNKKERFIEAVLHYIYEEDRADIFKIEEVCKLESDTAKRFEIRTINEAGKLNWIECGVKYISHKRIFMCTLRNVTEKKRLEEQKAIYLETQKMEKVRDEFLANISWELQSPLNRIMYTIQALESKGQEEKYVQYIRRSTYRLLKLVNNLIDMTRIERGIYGMKMGKYNIVEVIEGITLVAAKYVQGSKKILFETKLEEEDIWCDPEQIERVLLNLLSNAIKHTPEDGVIRVSLQADGGKVSITIEDNGTGIPSDKLAEIFEQFIQVDTSLKRQNEGSGIGLALAKALIEMHHGTIHAQSIWGQGTRVSFTLPKLKQKEYQARERKVWDQNLKIQKCRIEFSDIYTI